MVLGIYKLGKMAKLAKKNNCIVFDMGVTAVGCTQGRFGAHGKIHSLIAAVALPLYRIYGK